jgi:hypothetical protein
VGDVDLQEYLSMLYVAVGGVEALDVFLGMKHGVSIALGARFLFQKA